MARQLMAEPCPDCAEELRERIETAVAAADQDEHQRVTEAMILEYAAEREGLTVPELLDKYAHR